MEFRDPYEKELWEKVKPWLDGCHLREDAPADVVAADKELYRISWDLDPMQ